MPIGDASATDENGNAVNLTQYPNRIVKGTYHAWMSYAGAPIVAVRVKIRVTVAFAEYDTAGATPAETDANGNRKRLTSSEMFTFSATLTNAPAGVTNFVGNNYTALAETPVPNLAQNIYTSRATLDYDGTHQIIDPGLKNGATLTPPLQQIIGHWNVLNFSGGASAWASANMSISGTEIDLQNNHIRIEVGPSKHLQPQDWSSMLQFFRYRRLYLDSAVRATGYAGSNNNVDMALNTPDANTVPGLAVDQQQALLAPDAIQSGLSNLLTADATAGQITVNQQATSGGTSYTTGLIAPAYTGSGAPTSSTLAANAYYRVGHWYVDTSANALWRCTTAGTNATSAWAQISGGSGSFSVGAYNNASAYSVGSIVFVFTTITIGGVTILPGCYICIAAVPAGGTGNQVPQYPVPTGTVFWYCISMGINLVNTCSGGSSAQIYLNSSGTF
jgi:hypothetical protein